MPFWSAFVPSTKRPPLPQSAENLDWSDLAKEDTGQLRFTIPLAMKQLQLYSFTMRRGDFLLVQLQELYSCLTLRYVCMLLLQDDGLKLIINVRSKSVHAFRVYFM
jgi:hypothetical protein